MLSLRERHLTLAPDHLLKALLDDDQKLSTNLITAAGGDAHTLATSVDAALARMPKVAGGDGQIYMDAALAELLAEAGRLAEEAGDAVVSAERILLAIAMATGTGAAWLAEGAGIRP